MVGSPTVSYGNRDLFQRDAEYATKHAAQPLPARVYFFVGELEEGEEDTTMTDTIRFAMLLQSRQYEGLVIEKRIFPEMNHCDVPAPGFQAGLKFALKRI
jgi:hypothetical protein